MTAGVASTAISALLWKYGPTFGDGPCGQDEGDLSQLTGKGLRRAM
jgi:hypothetical protein